MIQRMWTKLIVLGLYGDKGCMNDCNQQNGKCLKACEQ